MSISYRLTFMAVSPGPVFGEWLLTATPREMADGRTEAAWIRPRLMDTNHDFLIHPS